MRKFGFFILGLFVILAALAGIAQSPWGVKRARQFLENALAKSGANVKIEKVQGALPHEIILSNMEIQTDRATVSIETLRLKISLLRLLKRELAFSEVIGEGVSFTFPEKEASSGTAAAAKLPFLLNIRHFIFRRVVIPGHGEVDLEGYLRVGKGTRYAFLDTQIRQADDSARLIASLRRNGMVQVRFETAGLSLPEGCLSLQLFAQGPWTAWAGGKGNIQGRFLGDFRNWAFSSRFKQETDRSWTFSRVQMKSDLLQASGTANVRKKEDAYLVKAYWQIPVLTAGSYSALAVTGRADATWRQNILQGRASMQGELFSKTWKAESEFSWEKGSAIQFPSYKIEAPTAEITGHLTLFPEEPLFVGTSDIKIGQLQELGIPNLFGSIDAAASWNASEDLLQALYIEGTAANLYWQDLFSESASFQANFSSPLEGDIALNLKGVRWNTLTLETASFDTSIGPANWPFRLSGEGEWTHPLTFALEGSWHLQDSQFLAALQSAEGNFFNYPFDLAAPVNFEYTPELFSLSPLELHVADARLSTSIDRKGENTDAMLSLKNFPIDFLSLNPLDISVTGLINLDATLHERNNQVEGQFRAAIDDMEVISLENLTASGIFEGSYRNQNLQLKGELTNLLSLDLSLPMQLEIRPFKTELLPSRQTKGRLAIDGRLENFLDFFNLGTHRLEGMCHCDLALEGTLAHPILEGTCTIEDGLYQNYYTGTELRDLSAHFAAKGHTLVLESLTAQDMKQGTLSATGEISLNLSRLFPFHFDVALSRLTCVQINLVTATASGNVRLTGNLEKATAKGSIEILESNLTIPDKIPRTLPELEIVYKNQIKPLAPPAPKWKKHYPLYLDLDVHAPNNIFISGRGLNSEWRGDFHLGGTYNALAAKGNIDLIQGEFLFSSRTFKLTDGSLTFTGVEKEMPYLNLSGSTDAKGTLITAHLRGPLNNPQVTLQSTPPLPLSSILSLLLFGQDLSEINSFQALQLVSSLASIAGEGPDVLERTRKALGVDRLRILTVPSGDEEEGETIAVQVGKYVAPGVIVTFTQGAEDNGANVGVEVELKHGFSFQIETQQKQEQGKFTLKWGMSY